MKQTVLTLAVGSMLALAPAQAQDTNPIVFGMYFRCNQSTETGVDPVVREALGPRIQQQIDAGNLATWGWLSHRQGGAWRRALFMSGTDRNAMMDARQAIFSDFNGTDAATELNSACPGHDDYIWTGVANSAGGAGADPAAASISTYHVCRPAQEARADQIFEDVIAPLYQKHMDLGHLTTWGWYAHRSGGRFRRLETASGSDHKTIMNMSDAIYREAFATDPAAILELQEICGEHVDYMWANTTQN